MADTSDIDLLDGKLHIILRGLNAAGRRAARNGDYLKRSGHPDPQPPAEGQPAAPRTPLAVAASAFRTAAAGPRASAPAMREPIPWAHLRAAAASVTRPNGVSGRRMRPGGKTTTRDVRIRADAINPKGTS